MDDVEILGQINVLVDEEHRLESEHDGRLSPEQQERLRHVEEQLDQCWDLLRQRRARRSQGLDPDEAEPRPIETVEHYEQ